MSDRAEAVAPISKSDRIELRRIVKHRFELLREELQQRAVELNSYVKDSINAEYASEVRLAEKKSEKIANRLKRIAQEVVTLQNEMHHSGISVNRYDWDDKPVQDMSAYISRHLTGWDPEDLTAKVNEQVDEIKLSHGVANLNLRSQELSLLEDLSVDAILGEEARKFLGRIPQVDDILPLPSSQSMKELVAKT